MSILELKSLPEVRVGSIGSVLVSVWFSEATLAGMKAMGDEQRKLLAKHKKISTISIAVRIPNAPGPEISDWLKESEKEFKGTSRGTIVVLLERGLAAIIARSFIAAASLIRTNSMTVVKSYEEAAERLRTLPEQDAEIANDLHLAAKLEAFAAKR
jgi:hypothetical protein